MFMEWRKNLYQYEEQPPVHVWNLIATELESDVPEIRNKLVDLEAAPPSGTWENIVVEMAEEATVHSITPWYKKPWNIAAAAASAAILISTIYLGNQKDSISSGEISTSVFKPATRPQNNDLSSKPAVPQPILEADLSPGIAQSNIDQTHLSNYPKTARKTTRRKDSNYIYFTLGSGDERRLSYKLEEFLPAIRNRKQNELLDHWSAALENSAFVPSGNNFFDIVEMVKMVEEQR